jgi:hypothetical protein
MWLCASRGFLDKLFQSCPTLPAHGALHLLLTA